ncbi:shikimate dehydrogenase [Albimonas sp. CAU 1670]|uniref:shikimate dehydrogenase n=1 Tax=Albimonas sp. CAU 1670 TaxID=3032599 RepID=UPI0023DA5C59|nr:shikimate dehydrogenase [Albimonas sp. CAU 1670]MDF2235349.1 shikimate dehydrogenase [Albimonas sp. CAU 1670]
MADQTAPGAQASAPDARRRVLVGLIGQGIGPSRTPRMHMAEGRAQGIDLDYRLIDLAGRDEPLGALLDRLEGEGYDGLNVTYPCKRAVMTHLHALSANAEAVGAVNTVVFRDGRRFGHNTDHFGFAESFRRGLPDVARDAVLLLGAGGAGGAVAHALADAGVGRLMILDVDAALARDLAAAVVARHGPGRAEAASDPACAAQADGIVNATPVGMAKLPGLPLPEAAIEPRHWVADVVYFPLETALLRAARAKGCRVLPGSGMAIFQAARAFRLFTGREADPDRMRATFESFDAAPNAAPNAASQGAA